MNSFRDRAGAYAADVQVAYVRAGVTGWLVALGWIAFPFALQTLLHPGDAIGAQYALQGLTPPQLLTAQQIAVGFVETVFALGVLMLFQLVNTVLFYRRAQLSGAAVATPTLWPLAAVLPGVIGNAAWFVGTGSFDLTGCLIGLSPIALTVAAEMVCNQLGRDFVLGLAVAGQHPSQSQSW